MTEASQKIRIAVDAMGGDYAPGDIIEGAVIAAGSDDVEIALVGLPDVVAAELAKYDTAGLPIRCVAAEDVVTERENPALGVRRKPNASINVAARMVKEGQANGMISAGPTGAIATSAISNIGMIAGVERPIIGGAIFNDLPDTVVFDCGVNMDCRPYHLLTFAAIGTVCCRKLLGIPEPTVGLINIGAEPSKGNRLTHETYPLLESSTLNFIGNIEGHQIMSGRANVLVCDAFVGNVLFKFLESINLFTDLPGTRASQSGGGLILGIDGIVRKMHGASRTPHIAETVCQVKDLVKNDFIGALKAELHEVLQNLDNNSV